MTENKLHNENALLQRVAEKDEHAFRMVYDHYYPQIFAFAFRLLKSADQSEEVIQETMLHVWLMGDQLYGIAHFEGYLKTIAKRRAIDLLRRNHQDVPISALHEQQVADGADQDMEEFKKMEAARAALEAGIALLPEQQQLVYKLCYQQGLKYQEVADRLQLSHGTVQTHMKLALKFLRDYVRKNGHISVFAVIFKLL